eukprot:1180216-Pleurochrysis_carterae.AAC.1
MLLSYCSMSARTNSRQLLATVAAGIEQMHFLVYYAKAVCAGLGWHVELEVVMAVVRVVIIFWPNAIVFSPRSLSRCALETVGF